MLKILKSGISRSLSLVFLTLAFVDSSRSENLHFEKFVEGGKGLSFPGIRSIHQAEGGLVINWSVRFFPGPTFFDEWFILERELPYPAIAINRISSDPDFSLNDTDVQIYSEDIFSSDFIPAPTFHSEFDPERNDSWVDSMFIGWIQIEHYPWIYNDELGWQFVEQADPVLHGMAFWLYNDTLGWSYIIQAKPGWIWRDSTQIWTPLSNFPPEAEDPNPELNPGSPPSSTNIQSTAVSIPPYDSNAPGTRKLKLGQSLNLRTASSLSGNVSYRWYLNGILIPDQSNQTLNLESISDTDAGEYSVEISNDTQVLTTSASSISIPEIESPQDLINISSRGHVGSGNNVLIGGFVIEGDVDQMVLLRGVGPELAPFGLENSFLTDPLITLKRGQDTIATNDDWETDLSSEKAEAANASGAIPLYAGSKSSAILIDLAPGIYTAILSSSNGEEGVGLVEIYRVED